MTGSKPSSLPADSLAPISELYQQDKHAQRAKVAILSVLVVLCAVGSLFLSTDAPGTFYDPAEVLSALPSYLALRAGSIVGAVSSDAWNAAFLAHPDIYGIGSRFCVTLVTLICGGLLALAGSLYQSAFRNPIAAPTMLGVSNGVQMGVIVLVMQFGVAAATMTGLYYLYTYLAAVLVLLIVLGCGRLISGSRQFNVVDMLLVASIISQCCGFITTFLSSYCISTEVWEAYYAITEVTTVNTDTVSLVSLLLVAIIATAPVFLMRFSMNMISFTDDEARLAGVAPGHLRLVALVCGSIMVITAQVHCGIISMVSLVVPHLSRAIFGADFKKQFWGNVLLGMLVLLICRFIVGCIPFVGEGVPIGTVVSFVTLPLFVWIIARQQRGWE